MAGFQAGHSFPGIRAGRIDAPPELKVEEKAVRFSGSSPLTLVPSSKTIVGSISCQYRKS
jgi:hypothetical protein